MNESEPAAWIVMVANSNPDRPDQPYASRPTLAEALALIPDFVTARLRQGYNYRGCATYVVPTEECKETP